MAKIQTNVDKYRNEKKIKLKELAPKLGMTMNNLQKVKNDDKMTLKVLNLIAQNVGRKPAELLPDEWQTPPQKTPLDYDALQYIIAKVSKYSNMGYDLSPEGISAVITHCYNQGIIDDTSIESFVMFKAKEEQNN